jgi:hypothetical protein
MQTLFTLPVRILLVGAFVALVVVSYSYRSNSTGFTFATGDFNLRIDSESTWNGVLQPNSTWALKNLVPGVDKFFYLDDVKPGDEGEATISFHVNKNAWICLDFENLTQSENNVNEPEGHVDATDGASDGELAENTEFFAWHDDGDNVFEQGEKPIFGTSTPQAAEDLFDNVTYALADAAAGQPYPANVTKYIGVLWCFGDLTVNVPAGTVLCDGSQEGNVAQTDSFSVDIGFRAVPSKDNKNFTCKKAGNDCRWDGCNSGSCSVTVTIDNNGTIINNTTSNSNTGGNTAGSGGTVTTGDATSTATTTNTLNQLILRLFRR